MFKTNKSRNSLEYTYFMSSHMPCTCSIKYIVDYSETDLMKVKIWNDHNYILSSASNLLFHFGLLAQYLENTDSSG